MVYATPRRRRTRCCLQLERELERELDLPRWESLKYLAKERIREETCARLRAKISCEIEERQATLAVWLTKIYIVEQVEEFGFKHQIRPFALRQERVFYNVEIKVNEFGTYKRIASERSGLETGCRLEVKCAAGRIHGSAIVDGSLRVVVIDAHRTGQA